MDLSLNKDHGLVTQLGKKERNYGLELLRLVAAFYVLILHSLNIGGGLSAAEKGTLSYNILWFLQIISYGAVNIFVLISGYAGSGSGNMKKDWGRLLTLWLEVIYYSVLVYIVFVLLHKVTFYPKDFLVYFFPLSNNLYWFFSSFVGLYLIKPFLDIAVDSLDKKKTETCMIFVFLGFSIFSMVSEVFGTDKGYSAIWFIVLYLLGAAEKKHQFTKNISSFKLVAIIISSSVLTWCWKVYGVEFTLFNHKYSTDFLISYLSPTITVIAFCHVILFSRFHSFELLKKIILFSAPSVFTVYLINTHSLYFHLRLKKYFVPWAGRRISVLLPRILIYCFFFFVFAIIIDKIRQFIFYKLKINETILLLFDRDKRMEAIKKSFHLFFTLSFLFLSLFCLWKTHYGFGNLDESVYLTIPYRLVKYYDALLVHEWNQIQLFSFLMYPLFAIYSILFPTTEGILLNFRYIFTILWCVNSLFLYLRMRRFSEIGASAASLCMLIYTPYGIMALSYNTLGIMMLTNACIIMLPAYRDGKIQYAISGVFFAASVLCCPFLVLIYCVFSFMSIYFVLSGKRNLLFPSVWKYFTAGVLILFVFFLSFVLSRASLSDVVRSIPCIMDDPNQADRSLLYKFSVYFSSIWNSSTIMPYIISIFIILLIISLFLPACSGYCFWGTLLLSFCLLCFFIFKKPYINYLMFPVCILGLYSGIHIKTSKGKQVFWLFLIPGVIYTFCINYSSDQKFFAISSAASVSLFASIVLIIMFITQSDLFAEKYKRNITICLVSLLFAFQIGGELQLRYKSVFWDSEMEFLTAKAKKGPEKGIFMTQDRLERYNQTLNELEPVRQNRKIEKVLVFENDPLLYLITEKSVASYSPWLSKIGQHTVDHLRLYYSMHPEKEPDLVIVPSGNYTDYMSDFSSYILSEEGKLFTFMVNNNSENGTDRFLFADDK